MPTLQELRALVKPEMNRIEARVDSVFKKWASNRGQRIFATDWSSSSLGKDGGDVAQDKLDDRPVAKFLTIREMFALDSDTPDVSGKLRWRVSLISQDRRRKGGSYLLGWCVHYQLQLQNGPRTRLIEKRSYGGPLASVSRLDSSWNLVEE